MDPQALIFIIATLLIIGFVAIYLQVRKISQSQGKDETTKLLTQLLSDMRGSMDKSANLMHQQTKAINERLDRAAQVISGVSKSIGEMSEIGRSMKDLQDFLRSPKLRGNVGEAVLKNLLSEMLPKQKFHLQYTFRGGETVDAAIQTEGGIIPIDSKFPMSAFQKMTASKTEAEKKEAQKEFVADVKKHVDDIAKKYIKPQEGTMDFALMYVPSESVYYEIVSTIGEIDDYGYKRRVRFVSPSTLYAYLRAIMESFRGSELQKGIKEVLAHLESMQHDSEKLSEALSVHSKHVKNSYSTLDDVNQKFTRLSGKISTATQIDVPKDKLLGSEETH